MFLNAKKSILCEWLWYMAPQLYIIEVKGIVYAIICQFKDFKSTCTFTEIS